MLLRTVNNYNFLFMGHIDLSKGNALYNAAKSNNRAVKRVQRYIFIFFYLIRAGTRKVCLSKWEYKNVSMLNNC